MENAQQTPSKRNLKKLYQTAIESIFCKTLIKRKTPTQLQKQTHSVQKNIGKNTNILYQKLWKDDDSEEKSEK